jgi:hypothetical protein
MDGRKFMTALLKGGLTMVEALRRGRQQATPRLRAS